LKPGILFVSKKDPRLQNANPKSQAKSYYWVFTLFFLLFGTLVAAITSLINYNIQYTNIEKEIEGKFIEEKQFKQELLGNFLGHAQDVVGAIAGNALTIVFSSSSDHRDRENLNQLLLAATASNAAFTQLRFIDASGMELVRIDRKKGQDSPVIASIDKLQDKSERYYFKEASQLSQGQFWHSNFDLNVEHGKIEIPIQPTFRIATPVFTENKFSGFIIANVSIKPLLSVLGYSSNFRIYIIDKEGEFILHPDPQQSWSRYLPQRANLQSQLPEIAQSVLGGVTVQRKDFFSFSLDKQLHNQDKAIFLLIPRKALLHEFQKSNLLSAGLTAITVLLVSFVLSGLVAIIPARLQRRLSDAYFEIKKSAEVINQHVITLSTDRDGVIIEASAALADISACPQEDIIGKSFNMFQHPDAPAETFEDIWQTISQGETWRGDIQHLSKNGKSFWLNHVITPGFDNKGVINRYTSISHDISDKKELELLSVTDSLTGLSNRRKLDAIIDLEFDRFNRYGHRFSTILLDVDHFKQINDQLGHEVGDKVLVELSSILSANIRKSDTLGRWGGEEFLIVCPETHLSGAVQQAENLRKIIAAHQFPGAGTLSCSFGVTASYEGDAKEDIFLRSDKALYKAKNAGRNCVIEMTRE
jgi:diguanylate cyclase (GGDEF)-like protein/PAS domain S-box-containing protein